MFHTHQFVPKEVKYPVVIRMQISEKHEPYQEVEKNGTAILHKCSCGLDRVMQMLGKREIWHNSIIEVEEK